MSIHSLYKAKTTSRDGEDGFTLIELLVVVVILGILIAIAIPTYLSYRKSANDKAAQSDLRNAISTLEVCNSENGAYPATATLPGVPCTGQKVSGSTGTTMSYEGSTTTYKLVATNSGGSAKFYCYNAATGGSVRDVSAANMTLATALTACT